MNLTDEQKKELRAAVVEIKKRTRVTKVVCTRSVKGKHGDSYVGFSAAWDTVQDDAGGGVDLTADEDEPKGMTLKESRLAALILGMQVDIAAHSHAAAGGNLSESELKMAVNAIKAGYNRLFAEAMFGEGTGNG
jgi:hypothetical protein